MEGDLRCKDLQPGDIMLKMNFGGFLGNYLQGLQWLFGVPDSIFMHAGIMSDSFHIVEAQGTGGGQVQTPKQMHQLLDDVLEKGGGHKRPFFCSEFVVYVYQFVAEQNRFNTGYFFSPSAAKTPPGELFDTLMHDPLKKFRPVGMVAPGERE